MSDNVAKAGIEDVLSSVKRLVSEEGRKTPSEDLETVARRPGRLVLTDALRVGGPKKKSPAPLKLEKKYSAEDSAKPMLLRACDIVRAGAPANRDEVASASVSNKPTQAETSKTDDDLAVSLSAKIEALEAAIAQTEDQWEPDGNSTDAYSGTPTQALPWKLKTEFPGARKEDRPKSENVQTDEDVGSVAVKTETKIAQLKQDSDDHGLEPEISAEPKPCSADRTGAVTMDQQALRALIADVVREELQGALGERITRNVRKMVRREIHRALAAQELD